METDKGFARMIDYQKQFFDNGFKLLSMFQSQGEKITNMVIDQNPWIPDDGKRICSYWTDAYQKQLDNCKKVVDTNFSKIEETLGSDSKEAKA